MWKTIIFVLIFGNFTLSFALKFVQLASLIIDLHKLYNFTTFVVIKSQSFDGENPNMPTFENFLQMQFAVPVVTIRAHINEGNFTLRAIVNFDACLCISFFQQLYEDDRVQGDITNYTMIGIRKTKSIFVFMDEMKQLRSLEAFFENYAWQNGFINLIALIRYEGTEMLVGYTRFATTSILNHTLEIESKNITTEVYKYKITNMKGFELRTSVGLDPPRVLVYAKENGKLFLGGVGGAITHNYARYKNAKLRLTQTQLLNRTFELTGIMHRLIDNTIDLSSNVYTYTAIVRYKESRMSITYPIFFTKYCVIAPFRSGSVQYMFVLLPFQMHVWYTILTLLIYFTLTTFGFLNLTQRSIDLSYQFCIGISALLFLPLCVRQFNCTWQNIVIYGPAIFAGFILTSFYVSTLTSFLSTVIYESQINNVADFIQAKLPILMRQNMRDLLIKDEAYPRSFIDLIHSVNGYEINRLKNALNTSYAYASALDQSEYALYQQSKLKKPIFHITNTCFTDQFYGFPYLYDSPFLDSMSRFIMKCMQAGLIDKWLKDSYKEGIDAGILTMLKDDDSVSEEEFVPLSIAHFKIAWWSLLCGYTLSIFSFCCELLQNSVANSALWLK